MRLIKRFSIAMMGAFAALSLCACGGETQVSNYVVPETMETVTTGVISQNDRFSLRWDDEKKCVLLEETATGYVWGTTPYEYYLTGDESYHLSSPLVIEYYNRNDGSTQIIKALDCIDDGTVSAEMANGSLCVTYYFEAAGIAVPVEYSLREDSLQLRLRTDDILESGQTELISVSVAPYLCSAANRPDSSAYLMIPSGSGALMYTDEDAGGIAREFSGMVYGNDPACTMLYNPAKEEAIRLPVFGAKDGDKAICGIIESGDGAARIDATAGNARNGYSTVYATFYVRGYNNVEWENKDALLLTEQPVHGQEYVVGYYPLGKGEADYAGMAACYRRYLTKNGLLQESKQKQQLYQVTVVGGELVKSFTLGVPHNTVQAVTTFDETKTIVDGLTADTGRKPMLMLQGFGSSGKNAGKIGGGLTFAGVLGGTKGHRALEDYCQTQEIPLFTDFELVRFTQAGVGVNPMLHTAFTADSQSVGVYPLKFNVRTDDTKATLVRFVQRDKLLGLTQKIVDFCNGRVSGVALSSFGQTAYSDYREDDYALRNGLALQAQQLTDCVKEDHPLLLEAANGYIAGRADTLSKTPLGNGGYDGLDEEIPFYSMVFGGYIPQYSEPVNLAEVPEKLLLKCVEAGVSPNFTVVNTVDETVSDASDPLYYGVAYDGQRAKIIKAVNQTADVLKAIAGSGIRSHSILQSGVTRTVFDNGTAVTVNHTADAVIVDGVTIEGYTFFTEKGA